MSGAISGDELSTALVAGWVGKMPVRPRCPGLTEAAPINKAGIMSTVAKITRRLFPIAQA